MAHISHASAMPLAFGIYTSVCNVSRPVHRTERSILYTPLISSCSTQRKTARNSPVHSQRARTVTVLKYESVSRATVARAPRTLPYGTPLGRPDRVASESLAGNADPATPRGRDQQYQWGHTHLLARHPPEHLRRSMGSWGAAPWRHGTGLPGPRYVLKNSVVSSGVRKTRRGVR